MTLNERFHHAKHWQLFLLTFGLPMVFQFYSMGTAIWSIVTRTQPDTSAFLGVFAFFPIMMILCMGTMFGWFWSIAVGLQDKVPPAAKMKTGTFKVFLFTPMVYIIILLVGMGFMVSGLSEMTERHEEPDLALIGLSMAIFIPIHLFCMFCIFYCLYFVAKTIKTIEFQREVSFGDFAGEFFLIWFYFIGIWIIQPRVNRIAKGEIGTQNPFDAPRI